MFIKEMWTVILFNAGGELARKTVRVYGEDDGLFPGNKLLEATQGWSIANGDQIRIVRGEG